MMTTVYPCLIIAVVGLSFLMLITGVRAIDKIIDLPGDGEEMLTAALAFIAAALNLMALIATGTALNYICQN